MDNLKVGTSMRFFFLVLASFIWVGIWLTGFNTASWVLYFPAIFLAFAAATGICPGMAIARRLFGGTATE